MSGPFTSPYWYRVRDLRPALRAHVRVLRQHFRGERWYLLHDPATGQHHRFSPSAHYLLSRMDGSSTLEQIFDSAVAKLGDHAPSQNEVILLLSQLHSVDALRSDVAPDAREVFARFAKHRRSGWLGRLLNPLMARFPLFDPDAFLERLAPAARHAFGRAGFAIWAAVVALGVLSGAAHWRELAANDLAAVLDPSNWIVLALTYTVVKALHELGHALAVKVWGGSVHEMGVMLLALVPVPYVDASAVWAFPEKRRRILVSAAGIMVELLLASLALFVWLATAPGTLRDVAWNVLLIGGVSTLLFNGNPLLRFDGYYVLSDAIEIPNLSSSSTAYLGYLFQHYVLGLPERRQLHFAPGERAWLVPYGILAFGYRVSVAIGIALWVAQRFFFAGVALALWGLLTQSLAPATKSLAKLWRDPRVPRRGRRVALALSGLAVAFALVLFVLPFPCWTAAEGVVWLPERSQIRAGSDGFVERVLVRPGEAVEAGTALVELDDPLSRSRLRVAAARERELEAQVNAARTRDLVLLEVQREALVAARAERLREEERARQRIVRSPSAGLFVLPSAENLPGRFVQRGELLGWVANFTAPTVRVVLPQSDVVHVRGGTRSVAVRLVDRPGEEIAAHVAREVPAASSELPSLALGAAGGGALAVDLRDAKGLTSVESLFQLDLALASSRPVRLLGGRARVRFEHAPAPLAPRAYALLRRTFLGRLGV
jgi:putative peptide zinc metalloprotease protein